MYFNLFGRKPSQATAVHQLVNAYLNQQIGALDAFAELANFMDCGNVNYISPDPQLRSARQQNFVNACSQLNIPYNRWPQTLNRWASNPAVVGNVFLRLAQQF